MDPDIRNNKFLRVHMKLLGWLGLVYFKDQFSKLHFYKGILIITSYAVFNITEYKFLCDIWGDVSTMTMNGGTALLYTTVVIKAMTSIYDRKRFFGLVTLMHNNIKSIDEFTHSGMNNILSEHVKHSNKISWFILAFVGTSITVFSFYLFAIFVVLKSDEPIHPIAIDAWYPYDVNNYSFLTYLWVQWIAFLACVLVSYWNTMIIALLIYTKCELKILQYRLTNVTNLLAEEMMLNRKNNSNCPVVEKENLFPTEQQMFYYIKTCVKKHLHIIKFAEDIRDMITLPMSLDFAMFAILLCAEMFQVSSMTLGIELAITCGYLSSMFMIVLMYYWQTNEIYLESENISQAIYNSPWYNSDSKFRSAVILIMIRARRPLKMKAGFHYMTLETLIMILRFSYSSFTLLRQVDDR